MVEVYSFFYWIWLSI